MELEGSRLTLEDVDQYFAVRGIVPELRFLSAEEGWTAEGDHGTGTVVEGRGMNEAEAKFDLYHRLHSATFSTAANEITNV